MLCTVFCSHDGSSSSAMSCSIQASFSASPCVRSDSFTSIPSKGSRVNMSAALSMEGAAVSMDEGFGATSGPHMPSRKFSSSSCDIGGGSACVAGLGLALFAARGPAGGDLRFFDFVFLERFFGFTSMLVPLRTRGSAGRPVGMGAAVAPVGAASVGATHECPQPSQCRCELLRASLKQHGHFFHERPCCVARVVV